MPKTGVREKAIAAVTATVTNEAVLDLIEDMDEYADMIDEAAKAMQANGDPIEDKSQDWFQRMLVITPLTKSGVINIIWRQVKLAPDSLYLPYVVFKATGLTLAFDPITFPTEDDVIQITLALKAGQ